MLPWTWLKRIISAKNILWMLFTSFRWYVWSKFLMFLDIVVETRGNNCSDNLESWEWELAFAESNFNCNLQERHFVCLCEVKIKCYPNFITCIYLSWVLIRWNSSHCQLMEPFKSKESFEEKVDSDNNWKIALSRMILR